MATIVYSKRQFIQRIRQHLANGIPNAEFRPSENEVLLYIDSAIAAAIVNTVYNNAKITGVKEIPEGFLVTTTLGALTQNTSTLEWYADLPQPPLSLPLGESVSNVSFANGGMITPISNKRVPYREMMPIFPGTRYRVVGGRIYLKSYDGSSLVNETIEVEMLATRTTDVDEPMAVSDDVMSTVFDMVIQRCMQRFGVPQDILKDNLTPGNKSS